jgi:NADH:ubiquinone oxidoreductase subunit K
MVQFYGGILVQFAVSVAGILIMVGVAVLLAWYKTIESRGGPPKRPPDADLAGGLA